eukprot:m51a1_g6654 hypothetical protein (203) ;mRNA; r:142961-143853
MSKRYLSGLRTEFREGVFARDGNKCRVCGLPASSSVQLDAHHITDRHEMPNDGYSLSNGISLCPEHHKKAEVWHQTKGQTWVPGFHPDELYALIGSSYQPMPCVSLPANDIAGASRCVQELLDYNDHMEELIRANLAQNTEQAVETAGVLLRQMEKYLAVVSTFFSSYKTSDAVARVIKEQQQCAAFALVLGPVINANHKQT